MDSEFGYEATSSNLLSDPISGDMTERSSLSSWGYRFLTDANSRQPKNVLTVMLNTKTEIQTMNDDACDTVSANRQLSLSQPSSSRSQNNEQTQQPHWPVQGNGEQIAARTAQTSSSTSAQSSKSSTLDANIINTHPTDKCKSLDRGLQNRYVKGRITKHTN
jgi:hypothetical protein